MYLGEMADLGRCSELRQWARDETIEADGARQHPLSWHLYSLLDRPIPTTNRESFKSCQVIFSCPLLSTGSLSGV